MTLIHPITQDIFQVRIPVPFPLKYVNCYLFRENNGWTLLDTGLHDEPGLNAWMHVFDVLQISPRDIRRIILTHTHPDHFGLAGYFQNLSNAPVYALDREIETVPVIWRDDAAHVEALSAFFAQHGVPSRVVANIQERSRQLIRWTHPLPQFTPLHENDTVLVGEHHYRVVWTPGHADGHAVLQSANDGLLLAGDMILAKITPNIGLWPQSDPNPLKSYLASLEKVDALHARTALTGHRAVIENVAARIQELRVHHAERAHACWNAARECSAYEIALKTFERLENAEDVRMAVVETLAHLEFLVGEGRAERLEGGVTRYRRTG
ncbi:MAG: MBL fold metallo-hydrolase [Chloroflexi bacterium]|nr:MBL fold metallo-hydrolase [Chloroflexota bacterium]